MLIHKLNMIRNVECRTNASEIKFLGLIIDDTLSWKQHIEQVLDKMCTACYALRNIKHIVLIDTLRVSLIYTLL